MPSPDTDISSASADELPDLPGPDEDDAEATYDPDGIEASRARELGLGVGARDLRRQRDIYIAGAPARNGGAERLDRDQLTAADSLIGDDASDLGIDEEFDSEPDEDHAGERHDDRTTFRGR